MKPSVGLRDFLVSGTPPEAGHALRASEEKYRTLFNSIDEGFAIWKVLYDDAGRPVDARILEGNSHFLSLPGHADAIGKTSREVFPDADNWWIETFHDVIRGGVPVRFERFFDPVQRWLEVHLCPLGPLFPDQVSVVFNDVTERRRNAEALRASEQNLIHFNARLEAEVRARTAELKESRDLLHSVLDTSLIGMALLEAVRGASGEVEDFRIRLVNTHLRQMTGDAYMPGKLLTRDFPAVRGGLLDRMIRVLRTREPEGMEYPNSAKPGTWYYTLFVPNGDSLVASTLDITERKRHEEALTKAHASLELRNQIHAHAEEIAGMGTWTWNTATDVLTYSDNLYRLFGLRPGEIDPDLKQIARYIHPEDRERVRESSDQLRRTGGRAMALEYRVIRKDGSLRHFSNRVQRIGEIENGYMLVGITEDITYRKLEETHNRQLLRERSEAEERQRRALLAATLNTQEEERRRIAESLHNGIGQMLYGIQLNLNLLDLKPGDTWQERHARQQRATSRLLSDAITESRRISHAIMPHVLEDFGLKAAVDDICRQFHGKLKVDCQFATLPEKIEQYVQIALYRTIQELMTNVVKHAGARKATVRLRHEDGAYHLEVHDDGRGFDASVQATGIGLKTLREKIDLLKGDFDVQSGPEGTRIQVRVPAEAPKEP
ncbi:MAG: domain S-box protein [Fibrobacteria bacterium]|nr:domain S-box protein [Fibrobacteria bacterium]